MSDGRDEIKTLDEMCDDGPLAFILQEYYEHERVSLCLNERQGIGERGCYVLSEHHFLYFRKGPF